MEYLYLPVKKNYKIEKQTMLGILQDIIDLGGGNADMKAIGDKYGLSRDERDAVEEYLEKALVFADSKVYRTFLPIAKAEKRNITAGKLDEPQENAEEFGRQKYGDPISISLLQRHFSLSYPKAARIMQTLEDCGLIVKDEKGNKYFTCDGQTKSSDGKGN